MPNTAIKHVRNSGTTVNISEPLKQLYNKCTQNTNK